MGSQANVLSEYLVKLGFSTDAAGFSQFRSALTEAASFNNNTYLSMAKKVLEFQGAVTGAFAAAGAAALDIVDKVAQSDQEYRLFALHMYTSLPVARELKIALDALGQPLENIMWDPELARRFHQLVTDQQALTAELGPNFENQMLKIRDVRFEFTRLGVEIQYLMMMVVKDLAEAFGTTIDGLMEKMQGFNKWFIAHMPEISQWIASKLKPALIEVWQVLKDTGVAVGEGLVAFQNLIGLLSGDKSLSGTTLTFDKMATSIEHIIGWLRTFIQEITKGEVALGHLLAATMDFVKGDFKGAKSELAEANKAAGADGHSAFETRPRQPGDIGTREWWLGPFAHISGTDAGRRGIQEMITKAALRMGVPPELALAVGKQESDYRQIDPRKGTTLTSSTGALGVMQLLPSTARGLGVDPNSTEGNIEGGVMYLKQLLQRYHGNAEQALEHYYGSKDSLANQQYAQKVLKIESGIHIDHLEVNVPPSNLSADSVRRAVTNGIEESRKQETQRTITEFQTVPGWSYY